MNTQTPGKCKCGYCVGLMNEERIVSWKRIVGLESNRGLQSVTSKFGNLADVDGGM